jgi:hypothetical protein
VLYNRGDKFPLSPLAKPFFLSQDLSSFVKPERSVRHVKMNEASCALKVAQKLASLEGRRNVDLVVDFTDITLDRLDARVRRLEELSNIDSSPPMLHATCDSLTYCLRRLEGKLPPLKEMQISCRQNTAQEKPDTDPSALIAILVRLFNESPKWSAEDEMISAASQKLCHAAGRHNLKAPDMLENVDQLHAFAVELSLEVRKPIFRPPGLVVSTRPGNSPQIRKTCCGCCSCSCHIHRRLGQSSRCVVNVRRGRWCQVPRLKWLKKLWCFKSEDDDDSSTLADCDD